MDKTQYENVARQRYAEFLLSEVNNFKATKGEGKYFKILRKVTSSNKIGGLISHLRYSKLVPDATEIVACLNEIPYFIFSSSQTQAMAGLLVLQRWHEEINVHTQQFTVGELHAVAEMILDKCNLSR